MHTIFLLTFLAMMQPIQPTNLDADALWYQKIVDDFSSSTQIFDTVEACNSAGNVLTQQYIAFEQSTDIFQYKVKQDQYNWFNMPSDTSETVVIYKPLTKFTCTPITSK